MIKNREKQKDWYLSRPESVSNRTMARERNQGQREREIVGVLFRRDPVTMRHKGNRDFGGGMTVLKTADLA